MLMCLEGCPHIEEGIEKWSLFVASATKAAHF